ncbi:MAG: DNA-binding protein, partial [Oscillatoriales cyanobacterium]
MNTIAIALSDERLLKLQQVANNLNVSIEELVLIGIENLLTQ